MDIATIIGLLGAFGLIFSAISQPAAFIDVPSIMIVVLGSIMVVMLRSSLGEFLGAIAVMGKTFKNKLDKPNELITQIVELATIARKDGMIALEGQEISNPFLAKPSACWWMVLIPMSSKNLWKTKLLPRNCGTRWARAFFQPGVRWRRPWA